MEQLVARRAHNPKVVGSSPAPATKKMKSLESKDLGLFVLVGEVLLPEFLEQRNDFLAAATI